MAKSYKKIKYLLKLMIM